MTPTEIRTALSDVRDAVDVPPVDRLAFQARVRAARRRRTTGRGVVAVAGLAAAAALVAGALQALPEESEPPVADQPAAAVADPTLVVGFVVQDRLVVGGPGGFTETDIPARNVLGVLDGVLLQADYLGALVAVPVDEAGVPGEPERLATIDRAYLDPAGARVVVETAGVYRAWSPGAGWTDLEPSDGFAIAFDGDRRVVSASDDPTLTLIGVDGPVRSLPVDRGVTDRDLVAGVLALETFHGARFFDADTGRLLSRVRGEGTIGRLAPDGSTYARRADDGVVLVDPRTGRRTPVETEVGVTANGIAWTGPETFVVVTRDDAGQGALQECDAVERSCRLLYRDPSGTLKLTS
jgi:hypothetical protein